MLCLINIGKSLEYSHNDTGFRGRQNSVQNTDLPFGAK